MANYDAGHYFLTLCVPIRREGFAEQNGVKRSHVQAIRDVLATLPTAQQDAASTASGLNSPFARVAGTHFAHVFIIDDLRYNGRAPTNAIWDLVFSVDLLVSEKIDHLIDGFLVLTVDFDAQDGSDATLRAYSDRLWAEMAPELRLIFTHCLGFETVTDAASWFDWLKRCQLETTMPFNDYWTERPALPGIGKPLLAVSAAILVLAFLLGAVWPWATFALVLLTLFALVAGAASVVVARGRRPFPAAPDSDLASVLKALHVQQGFVGFAAAQQGAEDAALHAAFAEFCEIHRPADLQQATQAAGTLGAVRTLP